MRELVAEVKRFLFYLLVCRHPYHRVPSFKRSCPECGRHWREPVQ